MWGESERDALLTSTVYCGSEMLSSCFGAGWAVGVLRVDILVMDRGGWVMEMGERVFLF